MKNNKYSKFRNLNDGKDDDDFENFWKKNKHTKSIFENSELFAQNYSELNLNQDKATKPKTVQIVGQGEATPYWFKVNPLYSGLKLQ